MKEAIFKWLGEIGVYLSGATAFAYVIFRFFSEKWIETKFSERLEEFKHKQNKEIEELKLRINTIFNRLTKIHDKELEILPESWNLLQEAIGRVADFTSIYQFYPNLDRMTQPELETFLSTSDLYDFEKNELKQKTDKLTYYQERLFLRKANKAEASLMDFHNFVVKNRIFMTSELQELFTKIDGIMQEAKILRENGQEDRALSAAAYKKMRDEINPIKDSIEKTIQSRLHFKEA
jgi:hypothetical protein